MDLAHLTPVILTANEEANLAPTLDRLSWAAQIILIDSGSCDRTVEIARGFPHVKILTRPFDTHANQWNFGIEQAPTTWILSLDADYRVMPDLLEEIGALPDDPRVVAYSIPIRQCIEGRPLCGSLMPPRLALFRKDHAAYVQDGHTQLLIPRGPVGRLRAAIWHDDRKPFSRWLAAQVPYAGMEVRKLRTTSWRALGWPDRLRRGIVIAPWLVALVVLFGKGAILEGRRGFYYTLQRVIAELILSLGLLKERSVLDG